jgi:cell wall-associated NlpC family hydrolase
MTTNVQVSGPNQSGFRSGLSGLLFIVVLTGILSGCAASRATQNSAQSRLQGSYNQWKGTPYRIGGMTKSGVDCSAFVLIVMRDQFGVRLPRTTEEQLRYGKRVRLNRTRTGDLVFFRTGRKTLHVGIMVDHVRFMHASTSQGVMVSSMNEAYWRDRYLRSRRVI